MKVHQQNLPRVVIVGGGFGGLEAAKALGKAKVRVTLVDRHNHHVFQPLLYQVATAALSPADIAEPLRRILRRQENTEVLMASVQRIDATARQVITDSGNLNYEYLIVATGARHSYFGHDDWEAFAPGLKNLNDALEIRRRMLTAFEIAEKTDDPAKRNAAMTFVVVGGGPTGVEMAGAISEIARNTLVRDFRHIDSSLARVVLLDGSPRVLQAYPDDLSSSAFHQLERLGVEVRLGLTVTGVNADGVTLSDHSRIDALTVVWAAGNKASPLGESLGVPLDRSGRVIVKQDLSIPDHPEIFVIGDLAHCTGPDGAPLPGVSPVAMQQGRHAARNIRNLMAGGWTAPFEYHDKGSMATIGRAAAVADIGGAHFTGWIAWILWLFVHLIFLVGFRNKLAVLANWAYAYLSYGRSARLITDRGWHGET